MDPVGHRLHVNVKYELCPTMYKNKSASAEVRDITHLYCTDKSCRGQKCQSVIAGLECTDICTCGGECENQCETWKMTLKLETFHCKIGMFKDSLKLRVMKIATPYKLPLYWFLWGQLPYV